MVLEERLDQIDAKLNTLLAHLGAPDGKIIDQPDPRSTPLPPPKPAAPSYRRPPVTLTPSGCCRPDRVQIL